MSFSLVFALAGLIAFVVLYVWKLRPWLISYQRTAGVMATLQRHEATGGTWLWLKLKGFKTSLVLFLGSFATGSWGLVKQLLGLDPAAILPFQDSALWKGILADEQAIKAASIAMFVSAVLVLKGKVHDIKITPAAPLPPSAS